jgi:hypothetical protein
MICEKCNGMVILNGFSESKCVICQESMYTVHTPPYTVCKTCSNQFELCQQCGKEIDNIDDENDSNI